MRIGLMVEGQNGLTWERWVHIVRMAERLKFPSLFRSDHFFIGQPQDALEAYLSFAVAARESASIRFGPLVTPVTFRTPVDIARMAAQLDLLSGGRFTLGLGGGWNEPEHKAFGIPFPPVGERLDRLEEAILLARALWTTENATYEGKYYGVEGATMLPRPGAGRPPLLIGGLGEKRTLRLVAKYADEWNSTNLPPDAYRGKVDVLARHCEAEGRDPATIRRSMMAFGAVGADQAALDALARTMMRTFGWAEDTAPATFLASIRKRGFITGTTDEVVDQLGALAALGVEEVQFQHMNFDSDELPEYLAAEVAPRAAVL